jgi:hypothetical protein
MRERTWRETARILGFKPDPNDPEKLIRTGDGVASTWKGKAIAEIKRADVVELINQIVDRGSPKMANRTLAWIRKMFVWVPSQDIEMPVTEAVLNRISGSKGGIVGIYQRHEYTDEKRGALDKWAGHVEKLISNKATRKVARFRRQRHNLRTKDEAIC